MDIKTYTGSNESALSKVSVPHEHNIFERGRWQNAVCCVPFPLGLCNLGYKPLNNTIYIEEEKFA